jgi:hypothetical protein
MIDKHCGIFGSTAEMRPEQKELREQLNRLLLQEELKWKQRCKDTEIRQRDMNTRYFNAKANGRHRKKQNHFFGAGRRCD